jgi:hypothetical protein
MVAVVKMAAGAYGPEPWGTWSVKGTVEERQRAMTDEQQHSAEDAPPEMPRRFERLTQAKLDELCREVLQEMEEARQSSQQRTGTIPREPIAE